MKNGLFTVVFSLALASCSSAQNEPDSEGIGAVTEPVALEFVGQGLLVSLAGFQADQLSLFVRDLAEQISTAGEAMPLQNSTFEMLNGFGPETVITPTMLTAYTCNAGGQMHHETGRLSDGVGTDRSSRGDYDAFTFDACRHSVASGDYQLNGELVMDVSAYSASRASRSSHSNRWTDFSMTVPTDIVYELSGSSASSQFSAANFGSGDTRTAELLNYRKTVAGQVAESLEGVGFSLSRSIPNGSDDRSYQLDADGIIASPTTGGVMVTINTDPPLSGRILFSQGINEPFSGQVRMVAADGGDLILSANSESVISSAAGALQVDVVAMRADGEVITADSVPLIDIFSGGINDGCFVSENSVGDCGAVELP